MDYYYTYETAIGELTVMCDEEEVTEIHFGRRLYPNAQELKTAMIEKTATQIAEYLQGKRKNFSLPLHPKGTEFQRLVWGALCTIPYGEVRSYKDIAVQIGKPKACRAVGMANNRNPISIVIPCHRVIGADGSLTGYGGGLDLKQKLLSLEGVGDFIND